MSAHLSVYRFETGALFEGELAAALERIQLMGETKLVDALFVARDDAGTLMAVDRSVGIGGGSFAELLDFRLDPDRRATLTERTIAEPGGVPGSLRRLRGAVRRAGTRSACRWSRRRRRTAARRAPRTRP
jgi:hypothetical protein